MSMSIVSNAAFKLKRLSRQTFPATRLTIMFSTSSKSAVSVERTPI